MSQKKEHAFAEVEELLVRRWIQVIVMGNQSC